MSARSVARTSTTAFLVGLALMGCSQSPSRVRVQIKLAPDAQAMAAGPAVLDLYGAAGRVVQNQILTGKLPGDVVVLVNDDVGAVRVYVRVVTSASGTAAGTGIATVSRGKEVALAITLSTAPLDDTDGDGIPDVIDDCPGVADPTQQGGCAGVDMAIPVTDDAGVDAAMPVDQAANPCGNGVIDVGEVCDEGANNSDDPAKAASCTSMCKKRAPCGTVLGASGSSVDPATGHCYVAWPTVISWAAAERDCLGRGGHLASITSKAEGDRVNALASAGGSWIGVLSAPAAANVVWSNGESNAYTAFAAAGQGMGAASCVVTTAGGAGWTDRDCSYPISGLLPPTPVVNAPYVCETSCGNGVLEPGEECDPPAAGTCTNVCRRPRACTEPGGMISPATGYCYFSTATLTDYATAVTTACPAGTHLATPNGVMETEIAKKVNTADAWIAVSAMVTAQAFVFDVAGPILALPRYQGFADPDPDQATAPQCVVISYMHAGADGWRDRLCTATYPAICERDN